MRKRKNQKLMDIRQLPNLITGIRIAGTFCLLFIRPFSAAFYAVYSLSGISDVLDGWTARKLKAESEFGSRLDSVADLLFYAVMLVKILPGLLMKLPAAIWYAAGSCLAIRLASYVAVALKYHRFASTHTYLNKLTGAFVFAVPYVIQLPFAVPFCAAVCLVAGLASAEELALHILEQEYDPSVKTIFRRRK